MREMLSALRTLAERLSRNRALKRRLPVEFGRAPIFVSPDAQLKYLRFGRKAFDESLLRLAHDEVHGGDVVWDIGASVGVFSMCAAIVAGDSGLVLAVEPDEWVAGLLQESLRLPENKELHVVVLVAAVSNRKGTGTLLIAKRGRASNALESAGGRDQMGGRRAQVEVPVLTLDSLLDTYQRPNLVKIDIEGAEVQALEGAMRLLSEIRPKFYIEIGAESQEAATAIFRAHEYALFDPASANTRRSRVAQCTFNTLAVPAESAEI